MLSFDLIMFYKSFTKCRCWIHAFIFSIYLLFILHCIYLWIYIM